MCHWNYRCLQWLNAINANGRSPESTKEKLEERKREECRASGKEKQLLGVRLADPCPVDAYLVSLYFLSFRFPSD